MEKKDKIDEIRSDEVQEILSAVPSWMIRWGITLLFGLILMVLFISWFVKYPDVVSGQVVLTTTTPPSNLICQSNGYIQNIYFSNEAQVEKGAIIASIKNPVRKTSLDSLLYLTNFKNGAELIEKLKEIKDIGTLQTEVNTLMNNLIEFKNLEEAEFFNKDLSNIANQVAYNDRLAWITKLELDLLEKELVNAKIKYEADSSLFADSVIAKVEFFKNQSEYFGKKQQLINTKKNYVQYKIASSNLTQQENNAKRTRQDQLRQTENAIAASKKNIQSFNDTWEENFILTAPQSGKLIYLTNSNVNDFVTAGQVLFSIVPENESYLAVMKLKDQALGKVNKGQKVRMKFANYPYQEFGQLVGKVKEVSSIPSEEGYYIKIELENGLTTSYKKQIKYQPEMGGIAEIVTEDLRILERVFNNFRKVLDK